MPKCFFSAKVTCFSIAACACCISASGHFYLFFLQRTTLARESLPAHGLRRWVREYAQARRTDRYGLKVLNLFAYTCAFSVVALQAGAKHVVNVDMGRGAIATGQQNHQLNGVTAGASFLAHDIFSTWGKITRGGPYGLVIVDPPSYQKGSFVATKDYPRLMRRLPDLVAPGGHALICLNAPELGMAFLQDHMQECAPELVFVVRLANPSSFADKDAERALKVLVYRAPDL